MTSLVTTVALKLDATSRGSAFFVSSMLMPRSLASTGVFTMFSGMSKCLWSSPMAKFSVAGSMLIPPIVPRYWTCTPLMFPGAMMLSILPTRRASSAYLRTSGGMAPDVDGALTAFRIGPPLMASSRIWAASTATSTCASSVLAPRCGVTMQLSSLANRLSSGGSVENTSRAAPAIRFLASASYRAFSLMMPPRAQLISRTVGFIIPIWSALIMFSVCGFFGTWTVMKSDSRKIRVTSSVTSTPNCSASVGAASGS